MGKHRAIIPARIRNWLEDTFTKEQELEIRKVMVRYIAMNSEEKRAAQMLDYSFTTGGEKSGQGANESVHSENGPK